MGRLAEGRGLSQDEYGCSMGQHMGEVYWVNSTAQQSEPEKFTAVVLHPLCGGNRKALMRESLAQLPELEQSLVFFLHMEALLVVTRTLRH